MVSPPSRLLALSDEQHARIVCERDKTWEALMVFIDWRHKVLTRFFVASSAVVVAWRYLTPVRWELQALVLLVGCGISLSMVAMDRVNAGHLRRLYARGVRWERMLYDDEPGVFSLIRLNAEDAIRVRASPGDPYPEDRDKRGLTYGKVVRIMYASAAILFIGAAVATVLIR